VPEHEGQYLLSHPPNNGGCFAALGSREKPGQSFFDDVAGLGKVPAGSGDNLPAPVMLILYRCGHSANKRGAGRAISEESGDDFAASQSHKVLSRNIAVEGVFQKPRVVPAHAKDQEITGIAQDRVFEFVVVNLGKKVVREGLTFPYRDFSKYGC
jgi:hypothetical protein